ncbi:hypothetical protein PTKIN_Ptkin09bG0278300 [Pterospermum kingtungense]
MKLFSKRFHLAVARNNFHASYGAGFVTYLLPSQKIGGAVVPLIFKGHETEFRLFIIAIIFTFVTSLSALVIGEKSTIGRSFTFFSVVTVVLAVLVLAFVFVPDFFRCFLLLQ